MSMETAAIRPNTLSACEISRKDAAVLAGFLADIAGKTAPLNAPGTMNLESHRGRLLAVNDNSGCLMVMPFDVSCDGAATLGAPLFCPRAGNLKAPALAAAADRIAGFGARTILAALACEDELGALFLDAGFTRGARMIEMSGPVPAEVAPAGGHWVSYVPERRLRFANAFYRTLESSLDFPELPASGHPARLMRAFERRGSHESGDFALLEVSGQTAGIVLLAMAGSSLEVAYMGLLPAYRGKGLSGLLMERAFERAKARGAQTLRLTVDERNLPAVALYSKYGLREKRAVCVYYRVEKKS